MFCREYISRELRVFGVKFLTNIFICVKILTFRNSEITLAKEYYHPHHKEEKGEETRNHSFTSHGNLPASRLQNLFQTFFWGTFLGICLRKRKLAITPFPLWQPGNLQSFQTDPKK